MNDRLVWIDCEMTGLDIERDALVEIACLVTDGELALLDDGVDLVIKAPPPRAVDQMVDVVREMHNGPPGCSAEPSGGGSHWRRRRSRCSGMSAGHVTRASEGAAVRQPPLPRTGHSSPRDMPELDTYLH